MNETIKNQLNHRSIRKYQEKKIPEEVMSTLIDVARHTSTSSFEQSYSIIKVTDQEKKNKIAEVCQQHYVAEGSHLLIFVADLYRNAVIAKENHQETTVLKNMDRFMVAMSDAVLATQNVNVAAESLGIGTVILGSILNDSREIIKLLELPELTFPILGLALGYPDQEPQLKPRLPQKLMCFENTYQLPTEALVKKLEPYDAEVTEYYDLRNANRRVDSFTKQMTDNMNRKPTKRLQTLTEIKKQGLILE